MGVKMIQVNKSQLGFTLIELMIVVAIIGILAAIAYPNYQQYMIRGKRVDAQSEMLQIAQNMANLKLKQGTYSDATVTTIYGGAVTPKQGLGLYDLAFYPSPTTANEWTLIAKPIAGTQQADNGWICLNDQGQKFWSKGATVCQLSATSNWDGR